MWRLPRRLGWLLCASTLVACSTSTATTTTPESPARRETNTPRTAELQRDATLAEQLDAIAQRALDESKGLVAGFAVAVSYRGEMILDRGYGLADVERQAPVSPNSVFRIGSVTKQFTAAAIMKLAERGLLAVDDPLRRHLPAYPTHDQPITLRHLLTHTSGIVSYTDLPWFKQVEARAVPQAEFSSRFGAERLRFEPGSEWAYSNSGYYLLGLVIAETSGQSYAQFLQREVLPQSLRGIRACPDRQDYPNAARGYAVDEGQLITAMPLSMAQPYAAGALCSTAADLVHWSRALLSGSIVGQASVRQMTTPAVLSDGRATRYGFGLTIDQLATHRRVSHNGGINGFSSSLEAYPDDDLFIAVLVNTEGLRALTVSERLARQVLSVPIADLPVSPTEAAAVVGTYDLPDLKQTLTISHRDAKLWLTAGSKPDRRTQLLNQGDGLYLQPTMELQIRFEVVGDEARIVVSQGGAVLVGARSSRVTPE